MSLIRAKDPFRFSSRLRLVLLTGSKAGDVAELAEHLRTAPISVVYHHTHHFLQQHQFLVPEPPNDFAYWVANIVQDERLGERLAAIDTVRFSGLEELQRAIMAVLEERLAKGGAVRAVPPGKEFHFMGAVRFSVPTPYRASDLSEFRDCLRKVSISSLYLHVFEARLRPPLGINDFSKWFEDELGEKDLARRVAELDPYTLTLEGLRARIVQMVDQRLKELGCAAP